MATSISFIQFYDVEVGLFWYTANDDDKPVYLKRIEAITYIKLILNVIILNINTINKRANVFIWVQLCLQTLSTFLYFWLSSI